MSIFPIDISKTSPDGINSYGATAGPLWSGNIWTGAGERNDFAYVGINLQTDENGTLTFEFSQDGINWSRYPSTEFTVASGINEVHTAWKGGRYVRPIFTGTGGRTYFRIQTYYSNHPLPLSAPLNQPIGDDQDATITRAVTIGETPQGAYNNVKAAGVAFVTGATLGIGGTFSSGILDMRGYQQVTTSIVSDVDGVATFEFLSGATGPIVRTLNVGYLASTGFQLLSAPAFTDYVRYSYTNGATAQSTFHYETKFLTSGLSGQVLPINAGVFGGMVANLGKNVIIGQEPNGSFTNAKLDGVAFRTGATLGIGATYTSPLTSTEGYSQIETHLFADVDGSLTGRWYNDSAKTILLRQFTRPYAGNEVGSVSYFSAPVFGPYVEYEYVNGATAQAGFFLDFHPRVKAISGQVLGMNDFIPTGVVANLGRSVIAGQDENDIFGNVSMTTTTNAAGSYNNLNVVSGARPSQLAGRTNHRVDFDNSADALLYTVGATQTFYVTDVILTLSNTDTGNPARYNIRDGLTAGTGLIRLPLIAGEAPNSASTVSTYQHTFAEPMTFDTGVFLDLVSGTAPVIAGFITGYLE